MVQAQRCSRRSSCSHCLQHIVENSSSPLYSLHFLHWNVVLGTPISSTSHRAHLACSPRPTAQVGSTCLTTSSVRSRLSILHRSNERPCPRLGLVLPASCLSCTLGNPSFLLAPSSSTCFACFCRIQYAILFSRRNRKK